ncbi:uncharacterized protein LOC121084930 [Falco naumanni]|uniref:uncharacterized protein LOC121084930 n=1 Tax=Falco naumanni TaxID=148594 RepID=UPI001ADE77A1|nr:uncharacterized protein LOC121084930 [Falco naumanni]
MRPGGVAQRWRGRCGRCRRQHGAPAGQPQRCRSAGVGARVGVRLRRRGACPGPLWSVCPCDRCCVPEPTWRAGRKGRGAAQGRSQSVAGTAGQWWPSLGAGPRLLLGQAPAGTSRTEAKWRSLSVHQLLLCEGLLQPPCPAPRLRLSRDCLGTRGFPFPWPVFLRDKRGSSSFSAFVPIACRAAPLNHSCVFLKERVISSDKFVPRLGLIAVPSKGNSTFILLLSDTSRNCLSLLQCCFEEQKAFLILVNLAHTITQFEAQIQAGQRIDDNSPEEKDLGMLVDEKLDTAQ